MTDNIIPLVGSLAIKANLQGTLIYMAMLAYVASLFLWLLRAEKTASITYFSGFIISILSVVWRWYHVDHIPLQNMFEIFLVLGASGWPVSWFCRRYLNVSAVPGDALLSFVFLFPAGLVFSDAPAHLPPALQSPLFGPHVMAYMLTYFIMAKAAFQALLLIIARAQKADGLVDIYELGAYRVVCLGFPLLTLGLILGSVWGKLAWGDYWNWDPKELWSLASWLAFLVYFHWRFAFGKKYPLLNSILVLIGFSFIIITLLWVNLSRIFPGLHSYAS